MLQLKTAANLVTQLKSKIEDIPWTCKRCDTSITGIAKLVSHNEECHADSSRFTCPVCEELNDDDVALKNHILAVHLDPEFLNIKQEPEIEDSMEDDEPPSAEYDDSEDNEGNKQKVHPRRSRRKSTKKTSFLNEYFEDGVPVPFGTHFLDGYGKTDTGLTF